MPTDDDGLEGFQKGRVPRTVRERQLLDVAERVFAREGYQGTSLERVAQEAGVARSFLNKLFTNKEGLYLACHARARQQFNEMLLEVAGSFPAQPTLEDVHEILRSGVGAYFRFVRDHGIGWDVLFGGGAAVAGSVVAEVEAMRDGTIDVIAQMLIQGAPRLKRRDAAILANGISGSVTFIAKWWRKNPNVPIDEVISKQIELLWDGLEQVAVEYKK